MHLTKIHEDGTRTKASDAATGEAYVGWTGMASASSLAQFQAGEKGLETIEIDPQFAGSLGFSQGDIVSVFSLCDVGHISTYVPGRDRAPTRLGSCNLRSHRARDSRRLGNHRTFSHLFYKKPYSCVCSVRNFMLDTSSLPYSRKCASQWSVNKSTCGCLGEQEYGFKWVRVTYSMSITPTLMNWQSRWTLQQTARPYY